jgi:hypothetical protein
MKLVLFLALGSLENRAIKHLLRFCRVVPMGMVAQWARASLLCCEPRPRPRAINLGPSGLGPLSRATPSAESHQPRVAQTDSRGVEGRRGETAGS